MVWFVVFEIVVVVVFEYIGFVVDGQFQVFVDQYVGFFVFVVEYFFVGVGVWWVGFVEEGDCLVWVCFVYQVYGYCVVGNVDQFVCFVDNLGMVVLFQVQGEEFYQGYGDIVQYFFQ